MSESFAELFEQSLNDINMEPGAIVAAQVVDIDGDWVTVNAGLKSEGQIPAAQFRDENGELTIAIGDEVRVLDSTKNWWKVKNVESGKEGYVPKTHLGTPDGVPVTQLNIAPIVVRPSVRPSTKAPPVPGVPGGPDA